MTDTIFAYVLFQYFIRYLFLRNNLKHSFDKDFHISSSGDKYWFQWSFFHFSNIWYKINITYTHTYTHTHRSGASPWSIFLPHPSKAFEVKINLKWQMIMYQTKWQRKYSKGSRERLFAVVLSYCRWLPLFFSFPIAFYFFFLPTSPLSFTFFTSELTLPCCLSTFLPVCLPSCLPDCLTAFLHRSSPPIASYSSPLLQNNYLYYIIPFSSHITLFTTLHNSTLHCTTPLFMSPY